MALDEEKKQTTIEYSQPIKFCYRWSGSTGDEVTIYAKDVSDLRNKLEGIMEIIKEKQLIKDNKA